MGKVKAKKWRRKPQVQTVLKKYQSARRIKFKATEIIREEDYVNGVKQ